MPVQPSQGQWAHAPVDARWHGSRARCRPRDGVPGRAAGALVLLAFASIAGAQLSGSATLVSDYRYRGVTLSDRDPAAQAGLTYDDPHGWFVGAFGSTARLASPVGATWQTQVYAGYASRISSQVSLEAGGDYSAFADASGYDYGEVYVGAAAQGLSVRIYYSPRYFGQQGSAVYGEINGAHALSDSLRIFAHVGLTRTEAYYEYGYHPAQSTVDGRIGIGADFDWLHLELAWVGISDKNAGYRITGTTSPNTVVLTLSHAF